jgi:outer membrane protein
VHFSRWNQGKRNRTDHPYNGVVNFWPEGGETMFLNRFFIVSGLIGVFLGMTSVPLFAQQKIGYVDSERILAASPDAVDAQKKLDDENEEWGNEIQRMNEELRSLREALDQQSLLLSEARKKEKQEEIESLYSRIQLYQNQKWGQQGEFFRRQQELLQPVYDRITATIHRIAEEEGYDFILDSVQGNLLYAQEKYDLTDQVIEALEKEAPSSELE